MTAFEYIQTLCLQMACVLHHLRRTPQRGRPHGPNRPLLLRPPGARRWGVGGLSKRCGCDRATWETCGHPWHFEFYREHKYRYSLAVIAESRGEPIPRTKAAAEVWGTRLRAEIRAGTFRKPGRGPFPVAIPPELDRSIKELVGDLDDDDEVEPVCCEGGPLELRCALCRRSPSYLDLLRVPPPDHEPRAE